MGDNQEKQEKSQDKNSAHKKELKDYSGWEARNEKRKWIVEVAHQRWRQRPKSSPGGYIGSK